jgi:hypothetical protein
MGAIFGENACAQEIVIGFTLFPAQDIPGINKKMSKVIIKPHTNFSFMTPSVIFLVVNEVHYSYNYNLAIGT